MTARQVLVSVRKWREIVKFLMERGVLERSGYHTNGMGLTVDFSMHLINYKVLPNNRYDRSFDTFASLLARYCPGLNGGDLDAAARITLTMELADESDPRGLRAKVAMDERKESGEEESEEEEEERRAYSTCDLTKMVDNSINAGCRGSS